MVHDTTGDSLWVDYGVHKEDAIAYLEKQAQEPVAWSEEDERIYQSIIALCDEKMKSTSYQSVIDHAIDVKNWLKSLKDRVQPQSHWKPSDEQMYWIKWVADRLPDTEKANEAEAVLEELLEELKKLKN